jgi:protein-L-isoaspartate(D-aspartate) O-methyltransferase
MGATPQSDPFALERRRMVDTQLCSRGIRDARVLEAMAKVPRHQFVPEAQRAQAYEDHPISIAENQTVSQPYIVAIMLEALSLHPTDTVLEIGTGSGYQTAILSELSHHVYSIERHTSLAAQASETLTRLAYENLTLIIGDGSQGLPIHAPFDGIVVSAAAPQIPTSLFEQLKELGRMVIPIGPEQAQQLQLVQKKSGVPVITVLEPCRFVPLIGQEAYPTGW